VSAANQGNVASVVLGVGGALVVTGVVLWFTAPSAKVSVGTNGRQVLAFGRF
jgi:hypothetical protein